MEKKRKNKDAFDKKVDKLFKKGMKLMDRILSDVKLPSEKKK